MTEEKTDNLIKTLLLLGLALGAVLVFEMVVGASWWAVHFQEAKTAGNTLGSSGFLLDNDAPNLSNGKSLIATHAWIAVTLVVLSVSGFIIAALAIRAKNLANPGNVYKLLYTFGALGLILTAIATQLSVPEKRWEFIGGWELTGAWAGAVVGWAIFLLCAFGLSSTQGASLESETRPDSSDG